MALELAITAPTEALSQEVLGIAEVIARDMTAEAIERAKQKSSKTSIRVGERKARG